MTYAAQQQVVICCAGVTDYLAKQISNEKIKKQSNEMTIRLVKNPDIIAGVSATSKFRHFVVGFAAET